MVSHSSPAPASVSSALAPDTPLLAMEGISKMFPGVLANDRVTLRVHPGEVHALLGENGAGKTTLMNILYGLYQPDEGEIHIAGRPVQLRSPKDAMHQGIGLVAQHFMLARRHSVVENIALGLDSTPLFYPTRQLSRQLRQLATHYGFDVDPAAKIWQLSAGEQQRVEILKALVRQANILILDEPTSVLTPQEAERLFAVMETMKAEGKAIIFITHKLEEVMAAADTITVLRQGRVVGQLPKHEANPAQLARLMVGRSMHPAQVKAKAASELEQAPLKLELRDVRVRSDRQHEALRGVSFALHSGEMLGVAGVAGNGQRELIEVLSGLRQPSQGHIYLDGRDITRYNARSLFEAGLAHIPEDRNHMGIVPAFSNQENLVLRHYRQAPFSRGPWLNWAAVRSFARDAIRDYAIATPSASTPTRLLSGGNVQKLILARELRGEPGLILAAHPTYGLDVSASELTHRLLLEQRQRGAAVLLVSEDLDEIFQLCDRIIVLFAGRIIATVAAAEADRDSIGLMMAGVAA